MNSGSRGHLVIAPSSTGLGCASGTSQDMTELWGSGPVFPERPPEGRQRSGCWVGTLAGQARPLPLLRNAPGGKDLPPASWKRAEVVGESEVFLRGGVCPQSQL